jgi:hypothetical protein
MDANLEDVKRHVATLSDEALLEVKREDLVEAAQAIYGAELAKRGLAWPAEEVEEEEGPVSPGGGLVSLGKYDSVDEARFARDLLRNEQIPAWLAAELQIRKADPDPMAGLELFTQADYAEAAELLLTSDVSDEELARQAVEAGQLPEAEHEVEEDELDEEAQKE